MPRLLRPTFVFYFLLPTLYFAGASGAAASPAKPDARVTQVIREVSLLPADAPARRAVLNETVQETSAVKTGGDSRAELTFSDLTITRLGANSLYSFKNAGRRVELNTGSTLLRVPKDSGGATILTSAVTTAISGTTVILEQTIAGTARLTVLEGTARLTLRAHPDQTRTLTAGQSLEAPPGAARLPDPKEIDLSALLKTSPLIVGFRPLPSQNLINNAIRQQQQRGQFNQPNQRNGPQGPQNIAPPPPPGPGGR
jgi:ferric-dicitrate binding protein FerR (iron transport regulator)